MPCSLIPDNEGPTALSGWSAAISTDRVDTITSGSRCTDRVRQWFTRRNLFGVGGRRRRTAPAARGGGLAIDQCHPHAAGSLVIECLVGHRAPRRGPRFSRWDPGLDFDLLPTQTAARSGAAFHGCRRAPWPSAGERIAEAHLRERGWPAPSRGRPDRCTTSSADCPL